MCRYLVAWSRNSLFYEDLCKKAFDFMSNTQYNTDIIFEG